MPRAALGARSALPDCVLLGLVALVAIAALSAVGALLATALLVVPAATTRLLCSRLRSGRSRPSRSCCSRASAGLWLSVELERAARRDDRRARRGRVRRSSRCARARAAQGPRAVAAAAALLLALAGAGCGSADGDRRHRRGRTRSASSRRRPSSATSSATSAATASTSRRSSSPTAIRTTTSRARATCSRRAGAKLVFASGDGLDQLDRRGRHRSPAATRRWSISATRWRRQLAGESSGPEASRFDPHWWHDPRNVERGDRASSATRSSGANPGARATYAARRRPLPASRAQARRAASRACFASVPRAQRKLVTDHDAFGYFANRYGIDVIGAVIPSQTTAGAGVGGRRREAQRADQAGARQGRLPGELDQPQARARDRRADRDRPRRTRSTATRSGRPARVARRTWRWSRPTPTRCCAGSPAARADARSAGL